MTAFARWDDLQRYILNGHKPKRLARELIEEAKLFLPDREFYYSGGLCLVRGKRGDYIWHFIVEMEQERLWNYPEFQQGYQFGLCPTDPFRDANPYAERSRRRSWDRGYILGLQERGEEGDAGQGEQARSACHRRLR